MQVDPGCSLKVGSSLKGRLQPILAVDWRGRRAAANRHALIGSALERRWEGRRAAAQEEGVGGRRGEGTHGYCTETVEGVPGDCR